MLLELGLRSAGGFNVLARLEDSSAWRDIPLLVLTAATGPDDLPAHRPVLHKPLEAALLLGTVRRMIRSADTAPHVQGACLHALTLPEASTRPRRSSAGASDGD